MLISIYIYRFELKCLRIEVFINALISEQKVSITDLVRKSDINLDSVNEIIALLFILDMLFNEPAI